MTTLKLPRKFWPSAESLNAPHLLSFLLIPPSLNIYTADRNSFDNFGGFPRKNVDGAKSLIAAFQFTEKWLYHRHLPKNSQNNLSLVQSLSHYENLTTHEVLKDGFFGFLWQIGSVITFFRSCRSQKLILHKIYANKCFHWLLFSCIWAESASVKTHILVYFMQCYHRAISCFNAAISNDDNVFVQCWIWIYEYRLLFKTSRMKSIRFCWY